ncbi:MAG TPA: hypothetical protein D7H93_01300 [Candidatus Poseidoniales archaeon]|nr:hypothetical protein [Candidatus Poseidoniaceae archaeon]DAC21676.1 MAG TPA: hypothetical protein D7H89_03825 [Candidatus Poseidoniales archaeon]DAC47160.1 MAG TPA: hypothetical protein D7H93_01300 [Candidatus Poseidoniales archaeon]HII21340.1 hypothetical protein [Candidatus Poseidoniaceae archaeon]HII87067.1 hypothetical protein [Candidatus Poseidoniaceae archaeon]
MAETEAKKLSVESWLKVGLMASLVLSVALIGLVSLNKQTVLSPYATADDEYSNQQLTSMRDDFASADFSIANTMSTPMLVNDWQDPHRTMLVIAGPEKPFDAAEASAVYDFVTKKGGKVILAANSTNAQLVADQFGVKYFGDMVLDDQRYYEMTDELDEVLPGDYRRLWAAASLRANVTEMGDERLIPCAQGNLDIGVYDNCRLPVLFHRPTAIQVLDDQTDSNRDVNVLAAASTSAVIVTDSSNLDINSANNPTLGEGKTGLIVRIDYPGISVLDQTSNNDQGEVSVTGSIVFVADHSALANHLWDKDIAEEVGYQQCSSPYYVQQGHNCWNSDSQGLSDAQGDTTWNGNGQYFQALMQDMMEKDNEDISTKITRFNDNFFIVFDESRHVASPLSAPFTEAMGAIVLLTSDVVLKWLIILNLFALLAIAIMVVPEKENWRHVFDLTRFRERPTKVDAAQYQMRTREALLSKVRQFNDLTRDEFMRKSPAEIMQMVRDPRLVELISSNRIYSNDELRELIPHIRRWGN